MVWGGKRHAVRAVHSSVSVLTRSSNASAPSGRRRPPSRSPVRAGRSAASVFPRTRRCRHRSWRFTATSPWVVAPPPVPAYIEELLPDIREGRIEPGRVFDRVVRLDEVPEGYWAMNDREAIKVMVKPR